ncbi:MAG: superoxide dismutase family protein [Niabella sp.]
MINKSTLLLAGIISIFTLVSCNGNSENESNRAADSSAIESNIVKEGMPVAMADLFSTGDTTINIGSAKFYQLSDGQIKLDVEITVKERADSNVAVHFHEHGDCGDKGNNTHGHWNPTNENHGKWGTSPFHSGDIGNIMLDANGHGTVSITTDKWSVDPNQTAKYIIGKGIIVHGGTDDYTSQPTGNSGPRIGCGVINIL